jgi:hypothetical protein
LRALKSDMEEIGGGETKERRRKQRRKGEPDLNGSLVTLKTDNFADKLVLADTDKLVHRSTAHLLGRHDCAAGIGLGMRWHGGGEGVWKKWRGRKQAWETSGKGTLSGSDATRKGVGDIKKRECVCLCGV